MDFHFRIALMDFHFRIAQVEYRGQTRYDKILECKPFINTYY